jgi:hypothetical protein
MQRRTFAHVDKAVARIAAIGARPGVRAALWPRRYRSDVAWFDITAEGSGDGSPAPRGFSSSRTPAFTRR